jgi:uncharacterized protein
MIVLRFQIALQSDRGVQLSDHQACSPITVLQALKQANIATQNLSIGVWSRMIKTDQVLQEGDRIECYMPLLADPKDARRARVNRSIVQQATKENAANRANNRAHRARRAAEQHLKAQENQL